MSLDNVKLDSFNNNIKQQFLALLQIYDAEGVSDTVIIRKHISDNVYGFNTEVSRVEKNSRKMVKNKTTFNPLLSYLASLKKTCKCGKSMSLIFYDSDGNFITGDLRSIFEGHFGCKHCGYSEYVSDPLDILSEVLSAHKVECKKCGDLAEVILMPEKAGENFFRGNGKSMSRCKHCGNVEDIKDLSILVR